MTTKAQSQTIPDLTEAIAQTEAELAQLQTRLAELRQPPAQPPADASPDQIIAASLAAAQAQATAAPESAGVELAINRLQIRLTEQQAALAAAQAANTRAAHEAKAAAAQAELRQLGEALALKMAEAVDLIFQIKAVAIDGDASFKALQSRPPAPGDGLGYSSWQPAALCNIGSQYHLPKLIERNDGGFGLGFEHLDPLAKENAEYQQKLLTRRLRRLNP